MSSQVSVKPRSVRRGPGHEAVRLRRVELREVGPFRATTIEFPVGPLDQGQWIVLLGDNGTGKTTLLRALGLGLADANIAGPAILDLSETNALMRESSRIAVTTDAGVHRFQYNPRTTIAAMERPAPGIDLFGYGTSRGTALGGPARDTDFDPRRAASTLFSNHARVLHASTWLRQEAFRAERDDTVRSADFFNAAARVVASLLPGVSRLMVEPDEVFVVDDRNRATSLNVLSDGYLTTLGWTIDLVARWADRYRDSGKLDADFAKDMPCVVLIDELDLHLHPKWQLDIIPRLRAAFPKTTFVVTTHNPLTLQGTRPGEVFVLERDAEGAIDITQRDITPGLDANRILTDWFGLPTTLDNDTRDLMAEHLKLLWEQVPESNARRRTLERTLRDRLGRYADTSLERIAQSVVAEVLHKKAGGPLADITAADRSEIVTRVEARLDDLDTPASTSSAREPMPTWRRKTTSKPRKATTTRKTATKRKSTTPRKATSKR